MDPIGICQHIYTYRRGNFIQNHDCACMTAEHQYSVQLRPIFTEKHLLEIEAEHKEDRNTTLHCMK